MSERYKIRILLIEDHLEFARMLQEIWLPLGAEGKYEFEIDHVIDLRQAEAAVRARKEARGHFDLILLDLGLPDSATRQTVERLPDLAVRWEDPIIVITGSYDVECVQKGAADFIHKTDISRSPKLLVDRIVTTHARHGKKRP